MPQPSLSISAHDLAHVNRTLFHQWDPRVQVIGGIDSCIRGLVRHSPRTLAVVGIDRGGKYPTLGEWYAVEVEGRCVYFMPVARLPREDQAKRVPDTALLAAGLLRYGRNPPGAILQAHRVEIGLLLQLMFPRRSHVQAIHGDAAGALEQTSDSRWRWAKSWYLRIERRAASAAADCVVFSRSGAERLRRSAGQHVRFCPTWFEDDVFFPRHRILCARGVIWVGRFEEPKDPILAVRTVAALNARGERWTLTMVGEGKLRQNVEAEIHRLQLSGSVRMTGALDPLTLAEEMRSHACLLTTSHFEGFPRIVVEALASGLPVVATSGADPGGLVRNLVGECVEQRDPTVLAEAVARAVESVDSQQCVESVAHLKASRVVPAVLDR